MKQYLFFLFVVIFCSINLHAQMNISANPSNIQFDIVIGNIDSTSVTIANTGTSAATYSLLTNPPALLANQVAYYPFQNTHHDWITNTTGSITGTTFAADRFGQSQESLYFDGVDDSYSMRVYNLENTFSFSFWANPVLSMPMVGESYGSTAILTNYILYPSWGGYYSRAGLGVALGTNGIMVIEHANSYMPCLLSYPANLSGWNHYTVVFSNHVPKLYINGVLVRTGITSPKAVTYMSEQLGTCVYGTWRGYVDDYSVFNTALTATQVADAYQFVQNSRFEIQPPIGSISAGQTVQVQVKMKDTTLGLGTYLDTLTLYQTGLNPLSTQINVTTTIVGIVPQFPDNVTITMLPNHDIVLNWSEVTLSTLGISIVPDEYRIYTSTTPYLTGSYTLLGSTTETQYTHINGGRHLVPLKLFYIVRAHLN